MRTTLDLPDDLFRKIKAKAALEGVSLKVLITRFVERGLAQLDRPNEGQGSRTRSPWPVAFPPTGRTVPALTNSDIERIMFASGIGDGDEDDEEDNEEDGAEDGASVG